MFLVLPAAVLFATVFTIGPLARHSELTAAKASGMSFHRLVRPLFVAAAAVVLFGIIIGDVAPVGTVRRGQLAFHSPDHAATTRRHFRGACRRGWGRATRAADTG